MWQISAESASRLQVVSRLSSLVFLRLPVSACRPDRAFLPSHVPLQQLVLLLAARAVLPFLPSSFPRAPCATSSLVTTSPHPFRQRRSRLHCRTICRLSLLLSYLPLPQTSASKANHGLQVVGVTWVKTCNKTQMFTFCYWQRVRYIISRDLLNI